VFLLEVVIIIAVEGMRLVATKKPVLRRSRCRVVKSEDPGTPALPVEISLSLSVVGLEERKSRLV
jgi:hypothetical protein